MKYTFEAALVYLKQGKKIRRASWEDGGVVLTLVDKLIYCCVSRWNFPSPYKFYSDDILAEDWEVVE